MSDDAVLTIRLEDTRPILVTQLTDEDDNPVALEDGVDSAKVEIRSSGSDPVDAPLLLEDMVIDDGPQGIVQYTFATGNIEDKGVYNFRVIVTFGAGGVQSFPQEGAFVLIVEDGTVMSEPIMRLRGLVGDRFQDSDVPFFSNFELESLLSIHGDNLHSAALEGWMVKAAAYSEFHDIEESGSVRRLQQKFKNAAQQVELFKKYVSESASLLSGRIVGKPIDLDETDNFDGISADPGLTYFGASEFVRLYPLYRFRAILGATASGRVS